jgi:hypothetical protein
MGATRVRQRGSVLLGLAGGMLAAAGAFASAYYVIGSHGEAHAATAPSPKAGTPAPHGELVALPAHAVEVTMGGATAKLTWAELGVELDPDEAARVAGGDVASLAAHGELPMRVDRDKAVTALLALKAKYDKSPIDASLDLEDRVIHDDAPGRGIDVYGSIPNIEAAARQGAAKLELATVPMLATVTKPSLGIDDISQVLGHYTR